MPCVEVCHALVFVYLHKKGRSGENFMSQQASIFLKVTSIHPDS